MGFHVLTTITTATAAIILRASDSLVIVSIVAFIAMFIQKEIVSGLKDERSKRFSQALNIVLWPLIFIFVITLAIRAFDIFL